MLQVRHLQFLGLLVSEGDTAAGGVSKIQRMAVKAQERYPTAVALGGILRTYSQTRCAAFCLSKWADPRGSRSVVEVSELTAPGCRAREAESGIAPDHCGFCLEPRPV